MNMHQIIILLAKAQGLTEYAFPISWEYFKLYYLPNYIGLFIIYLRINQTKIPANTNVPMITIVSKTYLPELL